MLAFGWSMTSFRRQNLLKSKLAVSLIATWCCATSETSAVILLGTGTLLPTPLRPPAISRAAAGSLRYVLSRHCDRAEFFHYCETRCRLRFDFLFQRNRLPARPACNNDAFSDLTIFQVTGTFPIVAPLCSSGAETGQRLVAIGRGTQRGSEIFLGGTSRGSNWGLGDSVQRWGENHVSAIVQDRRTKCLRLCHLRLFVAGL